MKGLARTFFSVEGTATRREWWIVSIAVSVAFAVLFLILLAAGPGFDLMSAMTVQPVVAGLVGAAMWLPSAPVTLRRLRDRGLPLWWLGVAFAWVTLSALLVRLADSAEADLLGDAIQLGGLALSVFFIVQLGLLPSKTAPEAGLTDAAAPDA